MVAGSDGSKIKESKMSSEREKGTANFSVKKPIFTLESDVVLPETTSIQIQECLAKLKYHRRMYHDWNFQSVDPLGRGTILNFYGPPGTGKTMAAEAFAGTLGLDFIHLGTADVESKFMGETAKNIRAAFEYANETGAVIFFDEADTLLGKRLSSVTQGVDNEVNAMRSTLLIELERFEGVVIFATNFAKNYDTAFLSRISHHIKFDLPDKRSREGIWMRMLVSEIPLDRERTDFVAMCVDASEGLAGREIRNALRLALPKALIREGSDMKCVLEITDVISAIDQIRSSYEDIESSSGFSGGKKSHQVVKGLLGIDKE